MRFDPQPGDTLKIGPDKFNYTDHPFTTVFPMVYAQEGRKATVYQLERVLDNKLFALKVFKKKFQGPYVGDVARRIDPYKTLPGMAACERTVLTKPVHGSLIKTYPELEYAVLMPWVIGETWQDIVASKQELSWDQSLQLAKSAADVLQALERRGLAHCDIAGSNVLVDISNGDVILVDLEDMYGPNFPDPSGFPAGTAGYQHATSRTNSYGQWCAEGDRFSGAIFLVELLSWHDAQIRSEADGEHFFAEDEMQDTSCYRYRLMQKVLGRISSKIVDLFEQAWASPTLSDCPSFEGWADAISVVIEAPHLLEDAIAKGDESQIIAIWQQYEAILTDHPDADRYEARLELALERVTALEELDAAIASGDHQHIWDVYNQNQAILGPYIAFRADRHAAVEQAQDKLIQSTFEALKQAIWVDDDLDIEAIYQQDPSLFQGAYALTEEEQSRVKLAIERVTALRTLQTVLRSGNLDAIVQVYDDHAELLRACSGFTADERLLIVEAKRTLLEANLRKAIGEGSERAIISAAEEAIGQGCQLNQATRAEVRNARQRLSALRRLEKAIATGDDQAIVWAYNPNLLDSCQDMTLAQKNRLKIAQKNIANS